MRLITAILCLSLCSANAQWQHYPAKIVLQNGDSLKGEVLLYEVSHDVLLKHDHVGFVERYNDYSSERGPRWIDNDKISSIDIYNEKGVKTVEYKNLQHQNILWKLRKRKDSVAIYESLIFPYFNIKYAPPKMILVNRGQITHMYSEVGGVLLDNRLTLLLRGFINKRYNKKFKKSDFKTVDDLFDYILANG